jgi:flagellar biosynthetic protein FlhB
MAGDSAQKTERPTPKRLREAREKGQIAKSADLSTWAGVLATTVLIQITMTRAASTFPAMLRGMGEAISQPNEAGAARFASEAAWNAITVIAPLLVGLMIVSIVVNLAQVGLKPSSKRLKPDFKRLNALKGLKRMVSVSSWWEVGKAIAKLVVLIVVAWPAVRGVTEVFTTEAADSLDEIAALTARTALVIARNVSVAGLAIAAADYAWQRRRLMNQLKMSRQEVREEMKQQEGNPEVKRAIRSRQAAMSRNRMIGMVGSADVVIVNPTHYAVALRYQSERGAPEVLAKGADHVAARIRREAEKHGVPVVHEPVLTRALFKVCEVGEIIPLALYEAVAHLLAFVFGLRAKGRAQGYHELPDSLRIPVPA